MSGRRPHHNHKPTGLQAKILRALVEDTCAIQKGALSCVMIDPRGRQVRVLGNYTMQALLKTGWIESDPEDRRLFRISESGRAALSPVKATS